MCLHTIMYRLCKYVVPTVVYISITTHFTVTTDPCYTEIWQSIIDITENNCELGFNRSEIKPSGTTIELDFTFKLQTLTYKVHKPTKIYRLFLKNKIKQKRFQELQSHIHRELKCES